MFKREGVLERGCFRERVFLKRECILESVFGKVCFKESVF